MNELTSFADLIKENKIYTFENLRALKREEMKLWLCFVYLLRGKTNVPVKITILHLKNLYKKQNKELTYYQIRRIKRILTNKGLIEEYMKYDKGKRIMYYRINWLNLI